MATWLIIYLVGFFVALYICVRVMEDDNKRITLSDFFLSLFLSLFSWIMVLALWLGSNINHSENNRHNNLN